MSAAHKFIIAIALQVAVLLGIVGMKYTVLAYGTDVLVRIAPVDPTDPLRGDYAQFRLTDFDTLEIGDGRTLRLRIETDQEHDIYGDSDWYGSLEWVRNDRDYVGAYNTRRPDGFDGRARVIETDSHNGRLWWQPPVDVVDAQAGAMRATIVDLVRFGYVGVILELCDGTDAYGRPIVVDSSSLWGIEWDMDSAYLAEIVSELVAEVMP